VKVRGYRVEVGEIEEVLRGHEQVRESVVVQRQEQGSQQSRLVAYVMGKGTTVPSRSELRRYLGDRLPGYMVPSTYIFLRALPLTANGKIDRQLLISPQGVANQKKLSVIEDAEAKTYYQPRDEIELQLLKIWEEVLALQPISILDDFFELGGHSIKAVSLISQIRQRLGYDLPLTLLFQHPTIAELAVILRRGGTAGENTSTIVRLQPRGSRPPFFCVHPAGPYVFCYTNLARYLGKDQPFYGLQSPDLIKSGASFDTLESLAAHYITELRAVQPTPPYFIGGWSLGGVIAFEMAQQLQRQGYEVALLAIIDSTVPAAQEEQRIAVKPDTGDAALAKSMLTEFNIPVPDGDFYSWAPEKQFAYAYEEGKLAHIIPMDASLEQVRHAMKIQKMNIYRAHTYVPHVYPSRITLFRATESMEGIKSEEASSAGLIHPAITRGWEKLAAGGIEVHLVPGKHSELVEEPNVKTLATALRRCINMAQGVTDEPGE